MPDCRTSIIGIQIVYCDENGERQSFWVNLNQVSAIGWCDDPVGPKDPHGHAPIPKDPHGPGRCPPHRDREAELCWWDGNQWVCDAEV